MLLLLLLVGLLLGLGLWGGGGFCVFGLFGSPFRVVASFLRCVGA